jgi:hypothetical protein
MPVYKFRSFEELEGLEKKGKGIKWHFSPDARYWRKALTFIPPCPFPRGVFRFRSFKEANEWEMKHLIRQPYERTPKGSSRGL